MLFVSLRNGYNLQLCMILQSLWHAASLMPLAIILFYSVCLFHVSRYAAFSRTTGYYSFFSVFWHTVSLVLLCIILALYEIHIIFSLARCLSRPTGQSNFLHIYAAHKVPWYAVVVVNHCFASLFRHKGKLDPEKV